MIILITGASHTGKTVLSQRLLVNYHFPYLSIDHLKMGLIRSGNTSLTPDDDDELTEYLWPIVREMIKTAIENCQNMIVEGCYIPFDWRKDFKEEYASQIRFVCLGLSDAYIDAHFADITAHGSDVESRGEDSDCTAQWLKEANRATIEGFRRAGEPVTVVEDDYAKTIAEAEERLFITHSMQLQSVPFAMIKAGTKTIELRLYDEKRRKIGVGDRIEFTDTETGERMTVRVLRLSVFDSFAELYQKLPLLACGYTEEDVATAAPEDMDSYYTPEEQQKYGVVGITIALV